jgi:hypothetical protein
MRQGLGYLDEVIAGGYQLGLVVDSSSVLAAKIKAWGGTLIVQGNSPDLAVAAKNSLRFSVAKSADGAWYRIIDRLEKYGDGVSTYLLVGGVLLLVFILTGK